MSQNDGRGHELHISFDYLSNNVISCLTLPHPTSSSPSNLLPSPYAVRFPRLLNKKTKNKIKYDVRKRERNAPILQLLSTLSFVAEALQGCASAGLRDFLSIYGGEAICLYGGLYTLILILRYVQICAIIQIMKEIF